MATILTDKNVILADAVGLATDGYLLDAAPLRRRSSEHIHKERAVAGSVPCDPFGSLQQEYDRSSRIA